MTVKDLNKINFIEVMDEYTKQVIEEKEMKERVFTYPNGNSLPTLNFIAVSGMRPNELPAAECPVKRFSSI